MTIPEFEALTDRLHTVVFTPACGDCDDMLRVFGTLVAEHGWAEALDAFDRIAAEHLPAAVAYLEIA